MVGESILIRISRFLAKNDITRAVTWALIFGEGGMHFHIFGFWNRPLNISLLFREVGWTFNGLSQPYQSCGNILELRSPDGVCDPQKSEDSHRCLRLQLVAKTTSNKENTVEDSFGRDKNRVVDSKKRSSQCRRLYKIYPSIVGVINSYSPQAPWI